MVKGVVLRSNNNVVFDCSYHVVWCTKYRRDILLDPAIEARLKQITAEVCSERGAHIVEMESDKDHFHLLVEIDPQYGIHRLVKQIKGRSSKLLREEFSAARTRVPTLWTNSYFVSCAGGAPLDVIKTYVEQQKLT